MIRNYDSTPDDAVEIFSDIIRKGSSTHWAGATEKVRELEALLLPFGIGYVDDAIGSWSRITPKTTTATLPRWVVSATRVPTNHHQPESFVVEAADESDARRIVQHQLRDLDFSGTGHFGSKYDYRVAAYEPPPAGRVIGAAP